LSIINHSCFRARWHPFKKTIQAMQKDAGRAKARAIFGTAGYPDRAMPNAPTFPLSVAANGRYLVDAAGVPFPILGDSAWQGPHNLGSTEQTQGTERSPAEAAHGVAESAQHGARRPWDLCGWG
jgi:hypothetical protein